MQAIIDTYRQEKIPLRYLQLDNWWYHKAFTDAEGKEGHALSAKLPEGDWNRYGGTTDYTASRAVFPASPADFHEHAGLPFITHNRWIDPASAYHQRFKISGIAAVDPAFRREIATYLKTSGVVTYEQDWLSAIFSNSPELSSTPDLGDAFLDGMANACRDQSLTIQYCMALPRCFLQGSRYGNLTTIRTSNDRFLPARYHDFLYTSRFASALGIWPWCDVFMSGETDNLLISNLSAGPVDTGNELGHENRENIFKTIRADGVIIKPDTSVVPVDSTYIAEARKQTIPLVSTAHTDHAGHRTIYALVVNLPKAPEAPFTLTAADLGTTGPVCVYDYFAATARWLKKGESYSGQVPANGVTYLIVAPVGPSGLAFLGDFNKFVSMGRQRIASVEDQPDHLTATVLLTPEENAVTLHGYCHEKPAVTVTHGTAEPVGYDAATGHFTVVVHRESSAPLTPPPTPSDRWRSPSRTPHLEAPLGSGLDHVYLPPHLLFPSTDMMTSLGR